TTVHQKAKLLTDDTMSSEGKETIPEVEEPTLELTGDMEVDKSEDYEPSEHQTEPQSVGSADHQSNDDAHEEEDDDDYDPESIPIPDTIPESPAKSKTQTKTSGGFILDEEDEEEEVDSSDNSATSKEPKSAGTDADTCAPGSPKNGQKEQTRIREDPRGDMDAWIGLIAQNRLLGNVEELRQAAVYVEWLEMELSMNNFTEAERLFNNCLVTITDVELWTVYLTYIRRRNDLTNDPTGNARKVVAQAYDYVMDKVGLDKDSGNLWVDYIQFIRSGPGQIGGTTWQDQQKVDQLRKAYQRTISIPTSVVNTMWKEYDQFEMSLNKMNGRKFIQEHSPSYMTAKAAAIGLESLTRNLNRTTYPRLAPSAGFDGYEEFIEQVDLWNKWIEWEKSDPLVLEEEDTEALNKRILHTYNQALMALRFWPQLWVDFSDWCFRNNIMHASTNTPMGMFILMQGRLANPESVLLALKHADRIESSPPTGEDDPNKARFAASVKEPYSNVLDTLYDMCTSLKEKEASEIARVEQMEAEKEANGGSEPNPHFLQEPTKEVKIQFIKDSYATRVQLLNRTISFVWIALIRAMRRIQGKGASHGGGLRQTFTDARARGRLTSEVYVAVAHLEAYVYKDPVGGKIFERGSRLFPQDETFMLEYLKFLHSKDDTTNARVVFETCVNRLIQKPENLQKAKVLYEYFHNYESRYGELSQILKLEERMAELFPEDPYLSRFRSRFISDRPDRFNPLDAQIIVSPAIQQRPKIRLPSVEQHNSIRESSAPAFRMEASPGPSQYTRVPNSPKRPYPGDDMDENRPRKFARGESPLKGAAGRRLDQQRRAQGNTLHRDITFLLTLLPPASSFDAYKVKSSGLINILRNTSVPDFHTWKSSQEPVAPSRTVPPTGPSGGHRYNNSQSSFYGEQPRSPFEGGAGRRGHQGGNHRQQGDNQYQYQY
ncbi:hypothetical protein TD95_000894, partial [Thielaviopsis punctulata]